MESMAGMMEGMFPPGANPFTQGGAPFPPWVDPNVKLKKRGE